MLYMPLLNNITLLISLGIIYGLVVRSWRKHTLKYSIVSGVLFSIVAVIGMMNAIVLAPGLIFDGRSIIISIAGFLGGPVTALITFVTSAAYRIHIGGPGMIMGVSVIAESAVLGVIFHRLARKHPRIVNALGLLIFGIVVHAVMLLLMFLLPGGMEREVFSKVALPVISIYPVATVVLSLFFIGQEERLDAARKLQESEKKYRELTEAANSIILKWKPDGTVTYLNEYGSSFLGYNGDEIIGRRLVGTIVPETESTGRDLEKMLSEILESPEDFINNENENICSNGERVWVKWRNQALRDDSGRIREILSMGVDITEKRESEIALRQSERNLQQRNRFIETILGNITIGLAVNRLSDGTTVYINSEFEKIYGWPKEYLASVEKFFECVYPDPVYREEIYSRIMSDIESGDPERMVWENVPITARDGGTRYVTAKNIPIPEQDLIISTVLDVTDSVLNARALKQSEERLTGVLKSVRLAAVTLDREGRVEFCNDFLLELLERTEEEVIGADWFELCIPEDARREVRSVFENAVSGKEITTYYENEVFSKNGRRTLIGWNNTISRDENGNIIGTTGLGQDITDRRLVEAERLKASRLESVGLLAGGIAHDFNNILTSILGNISLTRLIAKQENLDELMEALGDAEIASKRARDLTKQLLMFTSGSSVQKEVVDAGELVRESVNFSLHGRNVTSEFRIADDLLSIEADSGQISQVVNNIVINAVQAMPEGGRITCELSNITLDQADPVALSPGRYVRISITDQGAGIDPEAIDRIFDPYFTTKEKGSGLGLATSYSIVKNHGGHIAVESTPGSGSRFSVLLPAVERDGAGAAEKKEHVLDRPLKILLMDDDPSVRRVAVKILGKLGMDVTESGDGKEALALCEERMREDGGFDVVILDLTVPGGMGGMETLKRLRRIDPDVVAFVSSGYSSELDMADFEESGFSGTIPKPYSVDEIKAALSSINEK